MKPTLSNDDIYTLGNDYPQSPASAFFDTDSYADGRYTILADTISGEKDPAGINKRILNNLPQSGWAPAPSGFNAYNSDDYATGEVVEFGE